jgi:hypothetical protein
MQSTTADRREPWNEGKLVGQAGAYRPQTGVPDDYPIFALADLQATGSTMPPIRRPLRATDRRRPTGYSFFWRREILHLIELPDFDVGALGFAATPASPGNRLRLE